jgi:hypothetical protein
MATSSTYDVIARFRVDATGAAKSLTGLQSSLRQIQGTIAGTQSAFGGMVTSIAGIAAGYVGFQAITGAIRSATFEAIGFQAELEATRIGLQSVLGAVEGTGFAGAADMASDAYQRLSMDALRSTATTSQLFGIYSSIVGPLRNAGTEMERVYGITNNTVAAASALGVDFEQAQRDIGAMIRGAAGVDVKLFSMLTSTGAIRENTAAFNAMTQPERIATLERALGSFSEAAGAYGDSFAGLSSSLTDFYQHFRSAAMAPVFEAMKTIMKSILDVLVVTNGATTSISQFSQDMDARLGAFGERIAQGMLAAFERIKSVIAYVQSHWSEIVGMAQTTARILKAAFLGAAATSLARALAGGVFGGLSNVVGLMATMAEVKAGLGAASLASAAGTAGIGGSVVTTGLGPMGAAVAQISAAFTPLLPIFAAVAVAVAAVGTLFTTNFDQLMAILAPITDQFGGLWDSIVSVGESIFRILRPFLRIIGTIIVSVVAPALSLLLAGFRAIALVLEVVMDAIADFAEKFEQYVVDPIVDGFLNMVRRIAEFFDWEIPSVGRRRGSRQEEETGLVFDATPPSTPEARRGAPTIDARGSRVTIEQSFKEADPDRIMVRMLDELSRMAEQRIQSGYVPALTRS